MDKIFTITRDQEQTVTALRDQDKVFKAAKKDQAQIRINFLDQIIF